MSDNFKETVNLKDKMVEMEGKRKAVLKKKVNKAEEIDRLYEVDKEKKNTEFKKINRPKENNNNSNSYKGLVFVLLVFVIILSYFAFFNKGNSISEDEKLLEEKWYSIELQNGDMFYGLIGDLKNDPLEIKNVYYNYNQENKETDSTGNLKLVKRGKETHGPSGLMNVYTSNVNFIEELNEDSKVLIAILANEE